MLIREWMTKDVITVTPDTSMLKASKLMKDHNIRRLPVLDGKHVVGIVSDRDIRAASPSKATTLDMHELYYLLSEVKVKDIMTSDPVTVYDTDAVDAAALLMENKGKIVSREKLMEALWQTDSFVDENTLSVNVGRLRKKLEQAGLNDFITTKFGVGYLIG